MATHMKGPAGWRRRRAALTAVVLLQLLLAAAGAEAHAAQDSNPTVEPPFPPTAAEGVAAVPAPAAAVAADALDMAHDAAGPAAAEPVAAAGAEPARAAAALGERLVAGAAAAAAMGPSELAAAAASAGWSVEKLERELAADPALKFDPGSGRLLYACAFGHNHNRADDLAASGQPAAAGAAAPAFVLPGQDDPPIAQAFTLHRCVHSSPSGAPARASTRKGM